MAQVDRLEQNGIRATSLNADTIAAAESGGRNLWNECRDGRYQVILCSPEQLASDEMNKLLDDTRFQARVGLVVVDEAHLIPVWGGKIAGQRPFRRAFLAIGSIRSRLRTSTVFLALSATLMPGAPLKTVEDSLGLCGDRYHPIKLDCERTNLHIILRRINHSVSTGTFADLDWLLTEARSANDYDPSTIAKTVIYIDNITQGHQLAAYLRKLLPLAFQPHSLQLIRHLHASTCAKCKDEILDDFSATNGESHLRIVIATEAFGCGIDIPDIQQVINLGTPRNLDTGMQRVGRAGRKLPKGLGIIYVNQQTWDAIMNSKPKRARTGEEEAKLCKYFQMVLNAHLKRQCISKCIKMLYSHRTAESDSESVPESDGSSETDGRCMRCSGCVEDVPPEPWSVQTASQATQIPKGRKRKPQKTNPIPPSANRGPGRLTRDMSARGRQKLHEIVRDVWLSVPATEETQFAGSTTFVPASTLALIFRHIRDLETVDLVQTLLGRDWQFWESHGEQLATAILGLRKTIVKELSEAKKAGKTGQLEESRALAPNNFEQTDSESDTESEDGYEDELETELERGCECPPESRPPEESTQELTNVSEPRRYTIRIPAGAFKKRALNTADGATQSG